MFIESYWLVIAAIIFVYLLWRVHELKTALFELGSIGDRIIKAGVFRSQRLVSSILLSMEDCSIFTKAPKKLKDEYIDNIAKNIYDDYKSSEVKFELGEYKHFNPSTMQTEYKRLLEGAIILDEMLYSADTDARCIKKIADTIKERY